MGNRIHKVLGYGFTDVKPSKDKRFSRDFWKAYNDGTDALPKMIEINEKNFSDTADDSNAVDYFSIREFKARTEGVGWYKDEKPVKHLYFSDCVKMSGYFDEMKSSPVVFVHPFEKWSRYDDLIDYYACGIAKKSEDYVELITDEKGNKSGIYPYLNFVNKKTGKKVNCYPVERWDLDNMERANKYGLTLEEWKNDVVPDVPYIIRLFCQAINAFKNPLTVYDLNAMIYNYWC